MTVRPSRPPLANLRAIAGFTLIEILLVIVIIMLLAGALVAFVLPQQAGAEKNTTRLLLMQVQTALDNYRLNLGHYPTEDEGGLGALLAKPQFENEQLGERWQGPYLKPGTKLLDPWGRQITYDLQNLGAGAGGSSGQTNGTPFRLFSLGPDGQPDTDDDVRLPSGNEAAADSKTVLDVEKK
jgi:general secretion pathway protein G